MTVRGKSRYELFIGLCLSIGMTLIVLLLYFIEGFEWLERRTYDLRVQYKGATDLQTSILLIKNDEATITNLGIAPSKVSRAQYAQAISHLHESGATIIAFDLVFSGHTTPSEDAALSQAIRQAGNVILARYIGTGTHVSPAEDFRVNELGEGLINLSLDTDGVLRSIPFLGVEYENEQVRPFLTLGAEVARLFVDPVGQFPLDVDVPDVAKLGSIEIPYPQGKMFINFYGPSGTFPSIPLWRVVKGDFDANQVKDKIILVGGTAATLHDYYQTPFGRGIVETLWPSQAGSEGRLMAGLEVHANVVQTVLDQSFIHRSSPDTVKWILVMLGMSCWALILLYPNNATHVSVISLLLLALLVVLSIVLFNERRYWLDVAPLFSLVNAHYGAGMAYQRYLMSRQKEQLRSMFSQYVAPEIVEHLWNQRLTLLAGVTQKPQDLTVTTLAVGVEGFSHVMSMVKEERVIDWTNNYLDEIGQIVTRYHGVIEDHAQDGLLVHFGIPVPRASEREICQDAQNAVRCALAIQAALEKNHAKWNDKNLPLLQLQAGICTGCAKTATVRGGGRLKFTTMGTPVYTALHLKHLAARVVNDRSFSRILCGAETVHYLGQNCIVKRLSDVDSYVDEQSSPLYQVLSMESMSQT